MIIVELSEKSTYTSLTFNFASYKDATGFIKSVLDHSSNELSVQIRKAESEKENEAESM